MDGWTDGQGIPIVILHSMQRGKNEKEGEFIYALYTAVHVSLKRAYMEGVYQEDHTDHTNLLC